jgi:hypothetical protein
MLRHPLLDAVFRKRRHGAWGGADLRKQIDELKKGQDEIKKELAEIKKLLQASAARAAAPAAPHVRNLVLDVGSNPFRGEATAKLTLVEFTDYQ